MKKKYTPIEGDTKRNNEQKFRELIEDKETFLTFIRLYAPELLQQPIPPVKPNDIYMNLLANLLAFSDRYEITLQFWPEQTSVTILKDGVELQDYGGDFHFAVTRSIDYLKRINKKR